MPLLVLYNPVCGSRSAKSFTETHVLPLLSKHNTTIDLTLSTEYAGHAGVLISDYLRRSSADLTVVLVSGDGTLHEIVNNYLDMMKNYSSNGHQVLLPPARVEVVLVPAGTANALYSSLFPPEKGQDTTSTEYRLQSVKAFLDGKESVPLTLAVTMLHPSSGNGSDSRTVVSGVVTSTCLHASILHDSEELRNEYPGIERFKIAAQRNGKRWYNATAKLLPSSLSGAVQIYDSNSQDFIDHPDWDRERPIVELSGPFIYFLSTVNVDRLEPEFRITPLARTVPSNGATQDIVIVRPLRDPSIEKDDENSREKFEEKIWEVMKGAYVDGSLIGLRYAENGNVVSEGNGPLVVEYVRCGGWEWIPDEKDERAPLVCADGDILTIPAGGRAVSAARTSNLDVGFAVYG